MDLIDVGETMLIFDNSKKIKNGAMTITKKAYADVDKLCKKYNLTIKTWEGDNDTGKVYVFLNEEMSFEDAGVILSESGL